MNVIEALSARHSVRAFLPKQVEKQKLDAILEAAVRTPSWANSQPWELFIATGATLDRIRKGYAGKYAEKAEVITEIPRPAQWPDSCVKRREQLQPGMARDCGDAAKEFGTLNQAIFNAPAAIYICVDKILGEWALYDVGAYTQSLMLAAVHHGLDTIPAYTMMLYPDVLRKELKIPDNLKLAIGIAIGYADKEHGINKFSSERSPLGETVRFLD